MNLSDEDELCCVAIDNGCWDSEWWWHLFLGPLCKAMCGGNPVNATRLMQASAQHSVGRCAACPLAYRWKGQDAFAPQMYRGRRQHDGWLHVHREMWPKEVTERATAEIERIAESNTNLNDDQLRWKQQVRGAKSVEWAEKDPDARKCEAAMIISTGIKWHLNKCFAAERVVTVH